jgi:hypothetical protein
VAIVSRLTAQKGIDLIKHCAGHSKFRGAQFILLGSAPDPKIQGDFNALANSVQDENAAFIFTYDEPLSHLIYAGADFVRAPFTCRVRVRVGRNHPSALRTRHPCPNPNVSAASLRARGRADMYSHARYARPLFSVRCAQQQSPLTARRRCLRLAVSSWVVWG